MSLFRTIEEAEIPASGVWRGDFQVPECEWVLLEHRGVSSVVATMNGDALSVFDALTSSSCLGWKFSPRSGTLSLIVEGPGGTTFAVGVGGSLR